MVCAFSGHRPEKLPWGGDESDARCAALKLQLLRAVRRSREDGFSDFACGMARGCDLYFFDAVQRLREEDPSVTFTAWLPCPTQADRWPAADRARYEAALARCDRVICVEPVYTEGCMLRRNRAMIDRCARLITVYDGTGGGTGAAVAYARRRGVEVIPLWL